MSEYDDMRAKVDGEEAARKKALAESLDAEAPGRTAKMVEAMWRAEGYEPTRDPSGLLHSPALLKSVGRWPPFGAKKVGEIGAKDGGIPVD